MNDDVLIVGSLKDDELRRSIDNLVNYVDNKTNDMANSFTQGLDKMKLAMKDFAITQKVSVDLMKQAWRDMSSSFDAMVAAQSSGTGSGKPSYDDNTIGALQQEITVLQKERKEMELNSDELRQQNKILQERKNLLKDQTTSGATKELNKVLQMPTGNLQNAEAKLRELERIQAKFAGTTQLSEQEQKKLANAIAKVKNEIDKIKPLKLNDVLNIKAESIDEITKKMRMLKRVQIDPQDTLEVKKLGDAYAELKRKQAQLMGQSIQLTHSNNYLAQSFGYIRNRIVYALTLGAITSFTKQIYDIRGQYELLERSLGILIDDMRKGSEMFNELNQMALKSPFTLMELATGAKQLLAYNFAEEEVVDTTRRLADISAALGVPMERLVYNLGQIKAQTALTARDARDFANAGLAIVPMLAQMYTEQKRFGDEIVTTADVFDMMSKKLVSYNDVMQVINKITDEGGKFFDFQAKQADTLRVKMANLTLAWNNMLNEIGEENQSILELPLKGLKLLYENWRTVVSVISEVIIAYGSYKAAAMIVSLWNRRLAIQGAVTAFFQLARSVKSAKDAMILFNTVCKANPIGLIVSAVAAAVGYFALFNDSVEDAGGYTEKFGKAGAKVINETEALFDTLKGISKESSNYKAVMGELNSILEDYGIETVKETDGMDVLNEKRRVAISLIKEETLERKHLNEVQQGRDEYNTTVGDAKERMRSQLKNAMTSSFGVVSENSEIRQNASAIANIISDVVEQDIMLIAGKTGDEYNKGVEKIYATIQQRMRDIGISEGTISKQWLDDTLFAHNDIVGDFINTVREAKEEQDRYTESLDKAYEAEKRAAESGSDFNDRVEQTQTQLMKAANDTDNFYKKIDKLVKDYSGLNIIDFLVKVKTDVPAWMNQKSLSELTRLSARFTALATNAQKAGQSAVNANGKQLTVEQLFERAAQYAQAAKNKQADIEARKTTTITREASEALKDYKQSLEAVSVAKNKLKQGTADQALVTEKETEAQKAYNKALEKGVSVEELRKAKDKGKGKGKKDPLGDALKEEVRLIGEMQRMYKEYKKAGVDADNARIASAKEYEKTLKSTNAVLSKFGIKGISGEKLASMDARALREYYIQLRDIANIKGNEKGVEALERAIRSLNEEITKFDYKKIKDGLNSELGKLKEEYDLAIELDANPELGNMFADMIGLNTDTLPRTIEQYAERYVNYVNKYLSESKSTLQLPHLYLTDDDLRAFEKMRDEEKMTADAYEIIAQAVKDIRDRVKKDNEQTTKEWDALVDKFGNLKDKLMKISKDTTSEIKNIINKFGNEKQKQLAIDLSDKIFISKDPEVTARLQEQLRQLFKQVTQGNEQAISIGDAIQNQDKQLKSKAYWEDFKDSDYYTMMFEDMSRNSTRAIQLIIDKMNELKDKVKEDPASMKALSKSLQEAQQELESRSSTVTVIDALKELREAYGKVKVAKQELAQADKEVEGRETALKNAQSVGDAKAIADATERLRIARERQKQATLDAANAETKYRTASKKLQAGLQTLSNELQNIQGIFSAVAKLFAAAGDNDTAEAINAINEGFSIMTTLIMGVVAAMILLETTTPWLLAIAAALSVIVGLVSWLSGNSNEKITEQVEKSELAVKRLENAYKSLENAIKDAYGTAVIGLQKAAVANKELQLVELKRQLALEQSRDKKDRDSNKIEELRGQIIDLERSIKEATDDITNGLLGISSVSDAITNFMDAYVEAIRNGEDANKVFSQSIDDMIANMVKKMIATKILGPWFENTWNTIQTEINARGEQSAKAYEEAQRRVERAKQVDLTNDDSLVEALRELGLSDEAIDMLNWYDENGNFDVKGRSTRLRAAYAKALAEQEKNAADAKSQLDKDTSVTVDDIRKYAELLRSGEPIMDENMKAIEELLKELGLINDTVNDKELSKLQQGISGITEDTAGAIEAYMNIVSQRVFEQNNYLMQIRDIMVGFNLDVQVATIGQILFQMQQSYIVQQAIRDRLDGWSNANGMAMRVEMV